MLNTLRRRSLRLLLLAGAALVTTAGVAFATIPGSTGVINGCYEKRLGILRVIDTEAGKTCTQYETPISWNEKGVKGDAGPQGIQGIPGPKGDKGDPGNDGVNGTNGVDGTDGAPGADGRDGASVTSATEPAGANCANGGSQFTAGDRVTYACNGARGADGVAGPQGPAGPRGPQGPAGPAVTNLGALNGIPCSGSSNWPGTLSVNVGSGVTSGGSGGAVTMTCVPVAPVTLTLSWTGYGSFAVRRTGESSPFMGCDAGVQTGPTYTCSGVVVPGTPVQIEALAGTLEGTLVSWGGACADIGFKAGWSGQCRLTMDADKSASVVFNP
jgi:hypothetical protein